MPTWSQPLVEGEELCVFFGGYGGGFYGHQTDYPSLKSLAWGICSPHRLGICVGVDSSQAMKNLMRGWGRVCLRSLTGAGPGAESFFAIEGLMPKPADAHENRLLADCPSELIERNRTCFR